VWVSGCPSTSSPRNHRSGGTGSSTPSGRVTDESSWSPSEEGERIESPCQGGDDPPVVVGVGQPLHRQPVPEEVLQPLLGEHFETRAGSQPVERRLGVPDGVRVFRLELGDGVGDHWSTYADVRSGGFSCDGGDAVDGARTAGRRDAATNPTTPNAAKTINASP
jgi:hypothetical protein